MRSGRDAMDFIERAIPLGRMMDDQFTWMMIQGNFGLAALLTDDADAARRAFRQELELCRELVLPPMACGKAIARVASAWR